MQRNVEKCKEMQRNAEKCNAKKVREIQRNADILMNFLTFMTFMTFKGMSYLISLNPLHLENIAYVGSYRNLKNFIDCRISKKFVHACIVTESK